jgi:hypothetical protein
MSIDVCVIIARWMIYGSGFARDLENSIPVAPKGGSALPSSGVPVAPASLEGTCHGCRVESRCTQSAGEVA